ncbi:unnamed protein product [Bathycoccus prasinos]
MHKKIFLLTKNVFMHKVKCLLVSAIVIVIHWTRASGHDKVEYINISLDEKVYNLIRTPGMKKEIHGYTRVKIRCGFLYRSIPTGNFKQISEEAELYSKMILLEKGTGYIDFQMPDKAWETVDYGFVAFPSHIKCFSEYGEDSTKNPSIFLSSMLTVDGFRPKLIANFIEHYLALGVVSKNMLFTVQITGDTKFEHLEYLMSILERYEVYFDIFFGKWSSEALMYHQAHKLLHCTTERDWILVADSDEFHEYPNHNVTSFLSRMDTHGYNVVNGIFLDRVSSTGSLLELKDDENIFKKFELGCRFHRLFHLGTPKKVMAFRGYLRINRGHHRLALCWFWVRRNYLHLTPWAECPPQKHIAIKPFEKRLNVHHFKWMKGQYSATLHKANVWKGTPVENSYRTVLKHLDRCGGICISNPKLKCRNKSVRTRGSSNRKEKSCRESTLYKLLHEGRYYVARDDGRKVDLHDDVEFDSPVLEFEEASRKQLTDQGQCKSAPASTSRSDKKWQRKDDEEEKFDTIQGSNGRICGRIVNGSVLKSLDTSFCKRLRFDEKLIYLHFQKTAGTSVESGLARFVKELNSVCKLHRIFARPSGSHYRKSHFTEAEQRADILAGHGYWGCHSKINISSTYVYAGFFRDPVKRALSHHLRSSCKQEKGCNMKKFGLLHAQNYFYNRLVYSGGLVDAGRYGETLQSKVPREIIERNKDGNLLNLAFQRIDEMKFVGIVEEFDQSMFLFGRFLSRHFGIPEDTQVSLVYCRSKNSYKNLYEGKLRPGSLDKMFKVDKHIFDIAKKKFDGQMHRISSGGSGYMNVVFQFKVGDNRKGTGLGFSLGTGVGREEDGPSVSVSAKRITAGFSTSVDPALAGHRGDVILGSGFKILYVLSDILNVDDYITQKCLNVTQEITWTPRKPTSYIINIFKIEDKFLPELKFLHEDSERNHL